MGLTRPAHRFSGLLVKNIKMGTHKIICGKLEIVGLVSGVGMGLYLSNTFYLVWGLAVFVMVLAGLHDLNKKRNET